MNPAPPQVRFSIAVTGHRSGHGAFVGNAAQITTTLAALLDELDAAITAVPLVLGPQSLASTRLHCLMADGTDRIAAELALERGYELIAPLPFGRRLNRAINSLPVNAADARSLLAGEGAGDPATQAHADAIRRLTDQARVFGLADQDEAIAALFLAKLDAPDDFAKAQQFGAESSRRVALAGRILIEQSDLLVAVWDGGSTAHIGGTGHTIAAALDLGAPVVWINPANPEAWQILQAPEALARRQTDRAGQPDRAALRAIVHAALHPGTSAGLEALAQERWHKASHPLSHAYRRVEALFGGPSPRSRWRSLRQVYETPDRIGTGSGAATLAAINALPGVETGFAARIERAALRRFAWADGISAWLSDVYRGGMVINFILSSLAIVGGIAYLPLVAPDQKWLFAVFELQLLLAILLITQRGRRRRWHGRWFETRRVAEYLRHGPLLLALGVARPPGLWLRGTDTSWPEFYARHALREIGLPRTVMTPTYFQAAVTGLLLPHVRGQRDYHLAKARKLGRVHHNLDRCSTFLFQLAVVTVALYLGLKGISALGLIDPQVVSIVSKAFTVLGVLFPTFGAGIAGIRYFGDFERFAAISQVTAEKLDMVSARIALLLQAAPGELCYGRVTELAHATDGIVIAEIEAWQAVFGGKQITVPV